MGNKSRTCKSCGVVGEAPTVFDPARYSCRKCISARATKRLQERRATDPEYRERYRAYNRDLMRKRLYGLERGQYDEMVASRDSRCEICGDQVRLDVDHCHASGEVRGLLCPGCNKGLGMFKDDPARLEAAISYLERTRSKDQAHGK